MEKYIYRLNQNDYMDIQLRRFIPIDPKELLSGTYGEWIILIMLCALFIALAGATLPERLTRSRTGKALYTIIGLILGLGLFMTRRIFNFNLESFGFLAIWLIIILAAFVTYGLAKAGMRKDLAVTFSYCLMFMTFYMLTPSLVDVISNRIPLLYGLLWIAFIWLVGNLMFKMFKKAGPMQDAETFAKTKLRQPDEDQINEEIKHEEKERKLIKSHTLKLTNRELKSIDDIKHHLEEILEILKDADQLTELQHQHLAKSLREIAISKDQFQKGMKLIEDYINRFSAGDQEKLHDLNRRYHATNDKKKREDIRREYNLEKRKLDIFDFWKSHEGNVNQFLMHFDNYIHTAATAMEQNRPKDAIEPIKSAVQIISRLHAVIKKLKSHEKYILKLSKTEQKVEEKERVGR